jgi:ankyrin repeat protein
MNIPSVRTVCAGFVATFVALSGTKLTPDPEAPARTPPGFFARAVALHSTEQIEFCLAERADVNDTDSDGRTPLMIAAAQADWPLVRRLIDAGARTDVSDASTGLTPLMIAADHGQIDVVQLLLARTHNADALDRTGRTALHHALLSQQPDAAKLLLPAMTRFDFPPGQDRDLLDLALGGGDNAVTQALLDRMPPAIDWTAQSRRALDLALKRENKEQVRMLLTKHRAPPLANGDNIPLLAQAIADNDAKLVRLLLECGADPNTLLPKPCSKKFVSSLSSKLIRNYLEEDSGITVLMVAAAQGKPEIVRALLDAGADRNRATARDKWIALYFGARSKNWKTLQTLLGGGPDPDQLRIEVSIASQHAALIRNGVAIFTTQISTGRAGFGTPAGDYVITDKERDHRSTIYKVAMPYFMRLSCLDFGLHEGVVPRYPASHGCIRLPGDAARKLFSEIPVGTVVTIN